MSTDVWFLGACTLAFSFRALQHTFDTPSDLLLNRGVMIFVEKVNNMHL